MVQEGQQAPDFTLEDQDGRQVSLSGLRGRRVVLYFYPRDDTPGCTREACAFRDHAPEVEGRNAVVLGVSPDDVASHRRFADKYDLNFRLLADPDRQVLQAYGVWQEKTMYGRTSMGVVRSTFLIDEQGIVRKVWRRVRVDGHAQRVLEAMA